MRLNLCKKYLLLGIVIIALLLVVTNSNCVYAYENTTEVEYEE